MNIDGLAFAFGRRYQGKWHVEYVCEHSVEHICHRCRASVAAWNELVFLGF
jgi:hypothetical protein